MFAILAMSSAFFGSRCVAPCNFASAVVVSPFLCNVFASVVSRSATDCALGEGAAAIAGAVVGASEGAGVCRTGAGVCERAIAGVGEATTAGVCAINGAGVRRIVAGAALGVALGATLG